LPEERSDHIDPRFLSYFDGGDTPSIHDVARLILRELIGRAGLLIGERLLAARLGVDIARSPDWPRLLGGLPDWCRYGGPFADAWPRWWAPLVQDEWWLSLPDTRHASLGSLNAEQRVKRLREHVGFAQLVPAEPILPGYSTHFRTLCAASGDPLDPLDGVVLGGDEPLPWQDAAYISIDAALERRHEDLGLRLHPAEIQRVNALRRRRAENG
jgi:hypothetical protein